MTVRAKLVVLLASLVLANLALWGVRQVYAHPFLEIVKALGHS